MGWQGEEKGWLFSLFCFLVDDKFEFRHSLLSFLAVMVGGLLFECEGSQ
jgi:hypothetical protein